MMSAKVLVPLLVLACLLLTSKAADSDLAESAVVDEHSHWEQRVARRLLSSSKNTGNSGTNGNTSSQNSGQGSGTSGNGNSGTSGSGTSGNGNSGTSGNGNSGTSGSGTSGNGNSGTTGSGTSGNGNSGTSGSEGTTGNGNSGTSGNGNSGTSGNGNSGTSGSEGTTGNGNSGTSGNGNSGKTGASNSEDNKDDNGGNPFQAVHCPDGESCVCYDPTWYCDDQKSVPGGIVTESTPRATRCLAGQYYRKLSGDCTCVLRKKQCVRTEVDEQAKDRGITAGRILHGSPAVTLASKDCLDEEYISAACGTTGGGNDPIITGFDMRTFHFNDVGNFTLLSDAEGYLLEATFVGVGPTENVPKETSWTSQVRIYNPKGDKITCHLPQIIPNTSTIEVSAQDAGSSRAARMTPFHRTSVHFEDMSATAVLSGGPNPVVIGCHVALPKLEVTVYQVSGWDQASQFESEKWAAPYTWLNFDVKLLKPLSLPVMGILGATYPVSPQDQAALDANSETAKIIRANVATDPVAMRELEESSASALGKARRLFSADMFPLAATFKGMQLP